MSAPFVRAADVEPLAIGDTFTIESKALGETRRINVYAPAAYFDAPDARLPVLYMPDGGLKEDFLHIAGLVQISTLNGTMRPFILVGIENTERRRDMTGPTKVAEDKKIAPRVGGSATFRKFIRNELMPYIDAHYRTTDEQGIVGESAAGLFIVETFFLETDLFDIYIAIDPSLWWNGEALVKSAPKWLASHQEVKATLFLAHSDEPGIAEPSKRLVQALEVGAPDGFTWSYAPMTEEQHGTIYHPAAIKAFRSVLGRAEDALNE